jgi:hypothetical protein
VFLANTGLLSRFASESGLESQNLEETCNKLKRLKKERKVMRIKLNNPSNVDLGAFSDHTTMQGNNTTTNVSEAKLLSISDANRKAAIIGPSKEVRKLRL